MKKVENKENSSDSAANRNGDMDSVRSYQNDNNNNDRQYDGNERLLRNSSNRNGRNDESNRVLTNDGNRYAQYDEHHLKRNRVWENQYDHDDSKMDIHRSIHRQQPRARMFVHSPDVSTFVKRNHQSQPYRSPDEDYFMYDRLSHSERTHRPFPSPFSRGKYMTALARQQPNHYSK